MRDKLVNIIDFLKSDYDKELVYYVYSKFKYNKEVINNLLKYDSEYCADIMIGYINNDFRIKKDMRKLSNNNHDLNRLFMMLSNLNNIVSISNKYNTKVSVLIDDIFAIVDQYISVAISYEEYGSYNYGIKIIMIPISNTEYNKTPLYRSATHIIDMVSKNDGVNYYESIVNNLNRVFGDLFTIRTFDDIVALIPKENISKLIDKTNESKSELPNIKKYEIDGFVVYQGRDAESNDILTFQWSNDDDLWFHVSGYPGSHCLIKVKDNLPTELTIQKVAQLAKKNSKAKNLDKATIVYCKKKFVKKESSMNIGQVKVDKNNVNFIEV